MSNQADINEVRAFYDSHKASKLRRREEIRIELEKRVAEEEREAEEALARLLHHKFNLGVTKKDLRWATRQYQSPNFKDIWDAVEYDAPESGRQTAPRDSDDFEIEEDNITFSKDSGDWDWTGIEQDYLIFVLRESENTGNLSLSWAPDEKDHALFNIKNLAAITAALKGVEL